MPLHVLKTTLHAVQIAPIIPAPDARTAKSMKPSIAPKEQLISRQPDYVPRPTTPWDAFKITARGNVSRAQPDQLTAI